MSITLSRFKNENGKLERNPKPLRNINFYSNSTPKSQTLKHRTARCQLLSTTNNIQIVLSVGLLKGGP